MPEEHHPPPPREADAVQRVGGGNAPGGSPPFTRQRAQREQSASAADSTILPLRATGPPDAEVNQSHHYWPFATSDLYNWKAQNPKFSEKLAGLIDLLDSVLFTHQPTWDDCQQLLQVLFTTEERERILSGARKLVPGTDGNPTTNQAQIDASFPLTRPQWDFNTAEGKERLWIYRQTLMGGLQMAARKPTNLAKVGNVQQGKDESPAAFLERIMEAFRTYTPMDPEALESKAAVIMAFVNQSAKDIRRKLQKIDRLGEKSLQDLLVVAKKVYNNWEPPEDKQACAMAAASSKQTRDLARILLATTADFPEERDRRLRQLADDARKGRDLLTKIGAQITFRQGGPQVTDGKGHPIQVLTIKLEDEYRLHQEALPREDNIDRWLQEFPSVWAETGGMGLATHRTPVLVELKPGESPVRIKQYPMSQEARKGIQPHIRRLRSLGVLVPCQSAWNTPLLPVKKPHTNDYRPVQDLQEVNKRVADIHPTVPNPYTLLSSLAPSRVWYTVLDLKDAFFSLPLAPQSQPLFAFEWHDPEEGYSGQLTWTRLPQGFKNSPTIFDEALHKDLVFTDTFSGWVEAYPTKHETAQTVAKKLLEDILPRGRTRTFGRASVPSTRLTRSRHLISTGRETGPMSRGTTERLWSRAGRDPTSWC
ncbi:uncharacterized protein LOC131502479 isoform X2 [Neofelis nebulosa]|uniref:uncharacterized protein LOC131502479 isoform X2 n=1 Tax=Neofelis nebulosa TaxID=61452 RepID=UPI00272BA74F|nr:uncharacterized protein LOC131502479 isoform X2 [Neofelis nebulosa]